MNSATEPQPPHPCCQFGRRHQWMRFVHLENHYACTVCGIEDDDRWWDEYGRWIGPDIVPHVNLDQAGWALRPT